LPTKGSGTTDRGGSIVLWSGETRGGRKDRYADREGGNRNGSKIAPRAKLRRETSIIVEQYLVRFCPGYSRLTQALPLGEKKDVDDT